MNGFFTKKLLEWNAKDNDREMPWKGEKDPYKIWLSEIILQQTRVEQGWNYYLRFIENFPTVKDLATAPETKVFKLWEGLGYYSRCRNLIASARVIHAEYHSKFPADYRQILALKGIGPYTAAAIASFAFNLPYAVVDGNVLRVIARFFGIDTPIDSTKGKAAFTALAQELLDTRTPGLYNQAIMDFGAVICKPAVPACTVCILQPKCAAFHENRVDRLPVKEKKIIKKNRWLYYFLFEYKKKVYLQQRTGKDIWQQLHEFFLVERNEAVLPEGLADIPEIKTVLGQKAYAIRSFSKEYRQQLTHQTLHGRFIEIQLTHTPDLGTNFKAVSYRDLKNFAFPKFILTYLKEKNVNLSEQ